MSIRPLPGRPALTLSAIVLTFLCWQAPFCAAFAQSDQKVVKSARSIKPQVKISDLKIGQQPQKIGESFAADSDWIENISFKIENISGKRIVFLNLNMNFPETRATGNMLSFQMMLGEMPGRKINGAKPLSLAAGESLEVSLADKKDGLNKFIRERQPVETIRAVELEVGLVLFEDKTGWSAGSFIRQDPDNPGRFKPAEEQ